MCVLRGAVCFCAFRPVGGLRGREKKHGRDGLGEIHWKEDFGPSESGVW